MKMISCFFAENLMVLYRNIQTTDYDNYPVAQLNSKEKESEKQEIAERKE